MKKIVLISIVLISIVLQGCSKSQPVPQTCTKKCERKFLLKHGYQKVKSVERCKHSCKN
jgi:PBP1b-binding outer membrane lipoprotein LpoB